MSDYYDRDVYNHTSGLTSGAPDIARSWEHFNSAIFAAAGRSLPLTVRELCAVAVALTTQCPYCIETHSQRALAAGASDDDLAEVAWVAAAIRGGAGYAHGALMVKLTQHQH